MPLNSPAQYPYTLRDFLVHWAQVEEETGEPLVLPGGDLAAARAVEAELTAAMNEVGDAEVALQISQASIKEARQEVKDGLERFLAVVRAYWADTPWVDLVPKLPKPGAALDKYLRPCRDGLRLWALLETKPAPPGAPLPIRVGPAAETGRAEYAAAVEGLRMKGLELEELEFALAARRAERNAVMRRVKALLTSYQRVVRALLPPDSLMMEVLPRLWPAPGHTPDPVRASGVWLPETGLARLTWTESKDALLDHYQVRGCAGAEYDRREESAVARIPAGAPRLLETARFLTGPGAEACFRVYVVLKTGNERASNPVPVERPG